MEVYLPVMENNGTYVIFTAQNVDDPAELMRRYPSALPNKYYHHSTNRFGRQPFGDREGEPMRLRITGRLVTDRVDALVVDNPNSDNEIPHITLATADGVKPFASNAELKAHYADIEPLDDYVDTTFRNNMSRSRKNESFMRTSMPLNEKRWGHNRRSLGKLDGKKLDTSLINQRKSVTEAFVRRITEMIMRKLF